MNDNERVEHILYVIDCLDSFMFGANEELFLENEQLKFACYGCLVMISEGTILLSTELKNELNKIQWSQLKGFRNRVIHEYFRLDWKIVWNIIQNNIPILKFELEKYNKL